MIKKSWIELNKNHHIYQRRIETLRNLFDVRGIDGFILPRADFFQNEMIAVRDERLRWLTNFSGSAGVCIITKEHGALFIDGRYTTQAKQESPFLDSRPLNRQSIQDWIEKNLDHGMVLGFDPWLHTTQQINDLQHDVQSLNLFLQDLEDNPIDSLWVDRPDIESRPISNYPVSFAGKNRDEKLEHLFSWIDEQEFDGIFIQQSDTLNWLLNIRGSDTAYSPLAQCVGYFNRNTQGWIFFNHGAFPIELACQYDLNFLPLDQLSDFLHHLEGMKISIDLATIPWRAYQVLSKNNTLIPNKDPCTLEKSRKNTVEIQGSIDGHIEDAIAFVDFWWWLLEGYHHQSEITAQNHLLALRERSSRFVSQSFSPISAMNKNAALIHYHATEETVLPLNDGIYLIDSGAQYYGATTDITRTLLLSDFHQPIILRELPKNIDYYKKIYTCILKGHIDLSKIIFPFGTTGGQLDLLARQHLWKIGCDYPHGTGHGVGSFLNVHEGPQGISSRSHTPLMPGMIVSNEPGYYDPGHFGMRIENLMVVEEREVDEKKMLGFRTLTMVPYDFHLIDWTMLDPSQYQWLVSYYATISKSLTGVVACEEFLQKILKIE
jgi:Xaa-Pro aminopeptidase